MSRNVTLVTKLGLRGKSAKRTIGVGTVRRLIDGVRPLLRQAAIQPKPPLRPPLSTEAAARFFRGLTEPIARARSDGSFIDVWSVAGLRRRELPNAAVVAWLIDPRGSHGQGALCLSALVRLIERIAPSIHLTDLDLDVARVQPEQRPLGSDRDRVDIVVETPDVLLFIEVKIDAVEGEAQLSRYLESAARVAAVRALADGGRLKKTLTVFLSPRTPVEVAPAVVHITWRELASALSTASRDASGMAGPLMRSFANHARSFG